MNLNKFLTKLLSNLEIYVTLLIKKIRFLGEVRILPNAMSRNLTFACVFFVLTHTNLPQSKTFNTSSFCTKSFLPFFFSLIFLIPFWHLIFGNLLAEYHRVIVRCLKVLLVLKVCHYSSSVWYDSKEVTLKHSDIRRRGVVISWPICHHPHPQEPQDVCEVTPCETF